MNTVTQETIDNCIADLADRICPEYEQAIEQAWIDFYNAKVPGDFFTPPKRQAAPAKIKWPDIHINDALENPELMALRELKQCSDILESSGGALLNIRCNFGTGILPSLFGCEQYIMPREMNTLPTAKPLIGANAIKKLIDSGQPDLNNGYGQRVFETAEIMLRWLSRDKKLSRWITIYHPDLQGPIDVAELIWGSDIFYAFTDQPETIHKLLELITDTYAALMRRWQKIVKPRTDGYSAHWGMLIKGQLMIRNDSLMNLSPKIYTEFVRDCDQRLFDEFAGGAIHYCGRGDHFIEPMSQMTGLSGINLSQPHLNDMEIIFQNTVDKNIRLIPLTQAEAERARTSGRKLHGMVCIS